jgi:hypothetical protein
MLSCTHPFGRLTDIITCRLGQQLVLTVARPADNIAEDGGKEDALAAAAASPSSTGGAVVDEKDFTNEIIKCKSTEEAVEKFLDRLDGVDSLFFLSGWFCGP